MIKFSALFVAITALFSVFGCKAEEAIPYEYVILIGQEFTPKWKSLDIGDEFGKNLSLQAYSKSAFGLIRVRWDGIEEAKFEAGGIVLARNGGQVKLIGSLSNELKLLLAKKSEAGTWSLLKKETLKSGELTYTLNLSDF